jgi:hypothetical protein
VSEERAALRFPMAVDAVSRGSVTSPRERERERERELKREREKERERESTDTHTHIVSCLTVCV